MKKRCAWLLLLMVLAVAMLWASSDRLQAVSGKPVVIGAIFSITGDNAPLGVPQRETVAMLEKQVNGAGGIKGRPVRVEVYDDAGKPEQAVQACQQIISRPEVIAIIGPTLSGPTLAIAQMCQDARVPLISCAASIKIVSPVRPYVFKTAQSDASAVARILAFMRSRRIKTVGFINDSNAFGASGREQWTAMAPKAGIMTVASESFGSSDTDMTSQLTKLRSRKPEAIVCWGTNPGPAMVARDSKRLNMKMPLYMSHGISNRQFISLAKSSAEGVLFPAGKLIVANAIPASDPQKKRLLEYNAAFQRAYAKAPNAFGGYAYDALMLVVRAAQKAGPNRAAVRTAIEKTPRFIGVSGVFRLSPKDHNGLDASAFAMVEISGGRWKLAK